MTTLKELKSSGAFVSDKPIQKQIKYTIDGQEFEASIFVKKLSIGDYEALFLSDEETRSRTAKAISVGIRLGEDGKEVISFQDAFRLEPSLAGAMLGAFTEVNNPKKLSPPASASSAI